MIKHGETGNQVYYWTNGRLKMNKVPPKAVSGNLLVVLYFTSKFVPMVIAGIAIYLGYKLFVLGVTGQASLVVDAQAGLRGQLINAAPGLFFAVGGVAALITTVWKGTSFTFADEDSGKRWSMCLPTDRPFFQEEQQ